MATKTSTKKKSVKEKEIESLKKDIDSLKTNVVALTRTLADEVANEATHSVEAIKERSNDAMKTVEESVSSNPGRSVLLAFLGGIAATALLNRRKR